MLTIITEDGTGKTDANCFVTLDESVAIAETRLGTEDFLAALILAQTAEDGDDPFTGEGLHAVLCLLMASDRLNQESWPGHRTNDTQRLKFPRTLPEYWYGPTFADDEVPAWLKEATVDLATLLFADETILEPSALAQFEEIQVGPIDLVTRESQVTKTNALPESILRRVSPWLRSGFMPIRR